MLRRRIMIPAMAYAVPSMRTPQRRFTDKVVLGTCSALSTSTTILAIFHLLVTPVSGTIAAATLSASAVSGALVILEGDSSTSGTAFGAVLGVVFGGIGGYYAKSSKEPWRK
ncbi:uncharacterized protein TEOVI_000542900 [Trypanosoma equiperdum]|uniref:Uncharacterized protein n=2 Tax=Trypanozoon TaxID=39700 RepID=Q585Q0_TRYB2|nr:hypothetical protein, conserved [Trypanosoma brucei brucei TREU927]AAX79718.1 hypothetical protein, conserved [Trypanosoma brucei]AAZ11723.1 hypothetical protein, conserved [Trypanosoma brucei brucei TREU927]SCU73235.1 hypothetical protein, conserved [Trypanosoma equiperdum]